MEVVVEEVMALMRQVSAMDVDSQGFEEASAALNEDQKQLGPEDRYKCLLLLEQIDDQMQAERDTAVEEWGIWCEGRDLLLSKGFGSPGLETVGDVLKIMSPEEQLVVVRAFQPGLRRQARSEL